VTLGLGLTAMSGVEARAADAASLQDEQLQESLGAEHFRATRRRVLSRRRVLVERGRGRRGV